MGVRPSGSGSSNSTAGAVTWSSTWFATGVRSSACNQRGGQSPVLVSLPPLVRWAYDWQPEEGSEEARLYEVFLKPRLIGATSISVRAKSSPLNKTMRLPELAGLFVTFPRYSALPIGIGLGNFGFHCFAPLAQQPVQSVADLRHLLG